MRFTQHSGRKTKYGIYNSKHNDRQFDVKSAENIHEDKIAENVYFGRNVSGHLMRYQDKDIGDAHTGKNRIETFEEQERKIYADKFMEQYEQQMARHKKNRQYKRVVDFDTWRKSPQRVPEEITYQVGKVGEKPNPEKAEAFLADIMQTITNAGKKYNYTVLDGAIHWDEDGVVHLHIRRVWYYTDANGVICIGQEKALEQAGIQLPNPDEEPGKYNNRKMRFDAAMRVFLLKVSKEHGFELETEPKKGAKHNRSKEKYLVDTAQEMLDEAKVRQAELDERERLIKQQEMENLKRFQEIEQLYNRLSVAAQAELEPEVAALRRRLPDLPSDQPEAIEPDKEI